MQIGTIQTEQGRWVHSDESVPLVRDLESSLHKESHWRPQAVCDTVLRNWRCMWLYTIPKQVSLWNMWHAKWETKVNEEADSGQKLSWAKTLPEYPDIQINFKEMLKIERLKYLLVIVDHLPEWVEASPHRTAIDVIVTKIILEQVIPHLGLFL